MSIKESIRSLADAAGGPESLPVLPPVGERQGETRVGRQTPGGAGGGPFAEADYAARQYWTTINVTSVDGLFTLQVKPIKSILLESGDTATFKEPV